MTTTAVVGREEEGHQAGEGEEDSLAREGIALEVEEEAQLRIAVAAEAVVLLGMVEAAD
jgi:hypothetical protein